MLRRALVALALLAASTVVLPATAANAEVPTNVWRQESPATVPGIRLDHSMFSDPSTGQTIVFGGRAPTGPNGAYVYSNETWSWSDGNWVLLQPATSPTGGGRAAAAVAFDPRIGDPVLFGGTVQSPDLQDVLNFADTWHWTGTTWAAISTQHYPSARNGAAMGYDPKSGQMILFGGGDSNGQKNDTWAFNGSDWTQLSPSTSPPARTHAVMALDPSTGQLIMYGGDSSQGSRDDTWTWTGTNWQQLTPLNSPSVGFEPAIAVDQSTGHPVLFGGSGPGGYSNALWDWTGSNWVKRTVTSAPEARVGTGMAWDAATGRLVVFGGSQSGVYNDTWTFGPSAPQTGWWQESPPTSPPARSGATIAFDGNTGKVVMFGGTSSNGTLRNDTWTWNGFTWTDASPATTPPARSNAVMGYDERSGQLVMFGGYAGNSSYRNDTWIWNGSNWVAKSPATSPSARTGAAMTYSQKMGRLVMFGGYDGSGAGGYKNDTWVWTGSNWSQQAPATSPSGRGYASMTYDPSSGQLLLYGGGNSSSTLNDTWTYNGSTWTQAAPATNPGTLTQAMMAFDARLGDPVLFGGYSSGLKNATWAWNGTNWRQLTTAANRTPGIRDQAAMTYAPNTGQLLMFGGRGTGLTPTNDTWTGVVLAEETPPVIDVSYTPNGLNGWTTTSSATLTVTASDAGSGLAGPPTCIDNGNASSVSGTAPNFTTTVSGQGNHSVQCDVSDIEGNHAFDNMLVKVDSVKPTVVVTAPTTPGGNFSFDFSEPVDIDPTSGSVAVIETENATNVDGVLSCPSGLDGTGRCASWTFDPSGRLMPGDYYDVYFQPANGGLTDAAGNAMNATFPNVRAATSVDNTDPEVSFAWGRQALKGTYGGSVVREHTGGASTSYTFKGKKVTWYTLQGPNQGSARVQITDKNNPVDAVVDNYRATTSKKVGVSFGGLTTGRHTITITAQGGLSDPAATDSYTTIDAFQVGTNSVVNTPNLTSHWNDVTYSYAYTQTSGSSFSVKFRGTSVSWYALFGPNNGIAKVEIDGVQWNLVDLYDGGYYFAPITVNGLTDAVHTLTVTNTGSKNAASSDPIISVDQITIG